MLLDPQGFSQKARAIPSHAGASASPPAWPLLGLLQSHSCEWFSVEQTFVKKEITSREQARASVSKVVLLSVVTEVAVPVSLKNKNTRGNATFVLNSYLLSRCTS